MVPRAVRASEICTLSICLKCTRDRTSYVHCPLMSRQRGSRTGLRRPLLQVQTPDPARREAGKPERMSVVLGWDQSSEQQLALGLGKTGSSQEGGSRFYSAQPFSTLPPARPPTAAGLLKLACSDDCHPACSPASSGISSPPLLRCPLPHLSCHHRFTFTTFLDCHSRRLWRSGCFEPEVWNAFWTCS